MISNETYDAQRFSASEEEAVSEEGIMLAVLQLARDIDDLTERADALGHGLQGIKLNEAAELCRQKAPEPGTR